MGLHTHSQIESCLIQLVEVRSFAVSQINISDTPGGSFVCLRIRGTNISWYGNIQILLETCGCYTGLGEWVEYFEEKKNKSEVVCISSSTRGYLTFCDR